MSDLLRKVYIYIGIKTVDTKTHIK